MKEAYPIVLTPAEHGYVVHVPDLDIDTEGNSVADAIDMAADAISLWGITAQDMGKEIPEPSAQLPVCSGAEIAAFAVVDFDAYRRATEKKTIRRNVSLPSWLNTAAEEAGINVSAVLQRALKQELQL